MDEKQPLALIGSMSIPDAERIRSGLARQGVTVELAVNPQTCGGGACSTKAELWAQAQDIPAIQGYFADQQAKLLDGLAFDPALIHSVFDPSQDEATCPACATRFSTKICECPECGLAFGVSPSASGCGH